MGSAPSRSASPRHSSSRHREIPHRRNFYSSRILLMPNFTSTSPISNFWLAESRPELVDTVPLTLKLLPKFAAENSAELFIAAEGIRNLLNRRRRRNGTSSSRNRCQPPAGAATRSRFFPWCRDCRGVTRWIRDRDERDTRKEFVNKRRRPRPPAVMIDDIIKR